MSNNKLPRDKAAQACGPDGHLADITSPMEQEFIVNILTESGRGDAWFGLLLNPYDGTSTWSDGSLRTPESWQDVYTDKLVPCIRLREASDYAWRDEECGVPFRFIMRI